MEGGCVRIHIVDGLTEDRNRALRRTIGAEEREQFRSSRIELSIGDVEERAWSLGGAEIFAVPDLADDRQRQAQAADVTADGILTVEIALREGLVDDHYFLRDDGVSRLSKSRPEIMGMPSVSKESIRRRRGSPSWLHLRRYT